MCWGLYQSHLSPPDPACNGIDAAAAEMYTSALALTRSAVSAEVICGEFLIKISLFLAASYSQTLKELRDIPFPGNNLRGSPTRAPEELTKC